ncbi:NAD kinase 2, mitochondrial isoform X3 [Equus przewalskii]|uniref:NAD(+) kinase n=1 Tax=Equus przewalskii TaxID=9798 RepID=A0ABM2FL50_EQUPR|nr:PREDICTED: NAD kinase 2, mitochondrial isoform X2 [Equus przewalskii]
MNEQRGLLLTETTKRSTLTRSSLTRNNEKGRNPNKMPGTRLPARRSKPHPLPAPPQTGSSWIPKAARTPNRIPALRLAAANRRSSSGSKTSAGSDWLRALTGVVLERPRGRRRRERSAGGRRSGHCAGVDGNGNANKQNLLALKGSSYSGLLERHHIHTKNVQHILDSLRNEGIEVRLVKRREYDEETVRWADAVIAAGGDGTMLLAASKVLDRLKPVIGVNTDPERSEGHLCLPVRYTHSFPEALQKFYRGEFRWLWRQRIRLYLEGTGINPVPVDLHEQQLSLHQHSRAFNIERVHDERSEASGPQLLPVRALNEVFIGESLSSRASYYEISVDDGPWEKQKSSGLNLCTGTGSKAWSFNINRVATQAVEDVLNIAKRQGNLSLPLSRELVEKVTNEYNESLLYSPEEPKILFSIREPIANRIFSSSRQRCFTSKVCVRSRCWDACMVVDGGTSFEFNDGAIASMMINKEDELRTVLLDQ